MDPHLTEIERRPDRGVLLTAYVEDAFGEDDFTMLESVGVEDAGERPGKVEMSLVLRGPRVDPSPVKLHDPPGQVAQEAVISAARGGGRGPELALSLRQRSQVQKVLRKVIPEAIKA